MSTSKLLLWLSLHQVIARHEGHLDMEGQLGFLKKVPGFE